MAANGPHRPGSRTETAGRLVAAILGASLIALFVLPLVALVAVAPAGAIGSAFSSAELWTAIGFTAYASLWALGISLALGVPLGYLLARHAFPGKAVLHSLITVPIVLPHLVVGLALLVLFAPTTVFGRAAAWLGVPILNSIWGVVLVMVYVSAPYTVIASELAFRSVEPRLTEAARSLGATPGQALRTVQLPLASRGIVGGALLSWARSVSEVGGFLILAYFVYPSRVYPGPVTNPISVYIYNLYQISEPASVAAAAVLVLVALGVFLVVRLLEQYGRVPWGRGGLAR